MKTKILLTGATGFIGKRLLYKLDEKGYQVRCLVRPPEKLTLTRSLSREPEIVYGEEGQMTLSYGQLTSVLVKAIQEQQKQIETQQKQIDNLKQMVDLLRQE